MRAQVSVWTIEGDHLESVVATDPGDVGQWVRVLAGPEGTDAEESFDLLVCTRTWLAWQPGGHRHLEGRHHLVVPMWDPAHVRHMVTQLFEQESAEDWSQLADRLRRHGSWEFDGYRA